MCVREKRRERERESKKANQDQATERDEAPKLVPLALRLVGGGCGVDQTCGSIPLRILGLVKVIKVGMLQGLLSRYALVRCIPQHSL